MYWVYFFFPPKNANRKRKLEGKDLILQDMIKSQELVELAGCPLLLHPWPVSLCELAFVCYRFTLAVSHTRN